jgi:glutamine amidotransferase
VIALIDYGAGNLTSVRKGLAAAGAEFAVPQHPGDVCTFDGIVIPGVGHFAATTALDFTWREAICDAVRGGTPLLGICLGLQFLFDGSDEAPDARGLGLLPGRCFRLPPTDKIPHVGWNTVTISEGSRILDGIPSGTSFYFTHSYAAPLTDACAGRTDYTAPFAAVVESGRIFGVQFHPEKSSQAGLRVLRNFVEAARC